MNKKRNVRRVVEWGKNVLIVLLSCSAVWLAARSQMFGPVQEIWQEEDQQVGPVQTQSGERVDAARPLRVTANIVGSAETLRHGIQYDTAASDALFQQTAGLLAEALSSAGAPEQIFRSQWERALLTAPGISFDFQGELPMPVLVGWLTGEDTGLNAVVRRMILTVWQDDVAVYYRDEESGQYYRCLSDVANQAHLTEGLSALSDNGAGYAFESEPYRNLDPDTLVTNVPSSCAVYTAVNAMSGGRGALEELMGDLGMSVDASSFYSSGDEQVARSGNDSIRLSARGVAEYRAGESSDQFVVSVRRDISLFETVEACRQLAAATVGARCDQARIYLMSAQESAQGLEVRFGYCLNGSMVRLEEGYAARFLVQNGQITQFDLRFRSYSDSGKAETVLPFRQAAAAMTAMGLEKEELLLMYNDTGADTVAAGWAAAGAVGEG